MSIKARAESANKKIDEVQATAIDLLEGQTTIVEMSADTMSLVKKSTSTICKAIFEATEVSTPTRFVILPYELPEPGAELSEEEQKGMLDQADEWMGTVTSMVEEGQGAVADPTSYARCFLGAAFKRKVAEVKSSLVNKTLYLYLVDELTGLPMYDKGGVYPIKIETKSDLVDQYMPMMQVGLQVAAMANGAASLANVFCPFVPSTLVPKSIMDKAEGFLGDLKKPSNVADFGSVQAEVEKGGDGGAKRGGELRDFEKFLEEHDKDRTYSGLKRVCDKETGEAIWVCDDSIGAIKELGEVKEKKAQIANPLDQLDLASKDNKKPSGSFLGSFSQEVRGLSAATAVYKKGELLKKRKYLRRWRLRSITLTSDGKFSWLGDTLGCGGGSKHSGRVYLTVNSLASIEEPEGERWPFTLITEERKIVIAAKTMEERNEWCEAITKFCSS